MNKLNGRNEEDRRVYERSARLILLLALRDVVPGAKVRFEHSIGHGIYMNVVGAGCDGVACSAHRKSACTKS